MSKIVVQVGEHPWTLQAIHLACALARHQHTALVLLQLIPVQHPSYLGTEFGGFTPTYQELDNLQEYYATAEDYGVEVEVTAIQYVTTLGALLTAVEHLQVAVLFAKLPVSWWSWWHKLRTQYLHQRLQGLHCQLFTLESEAEKPVSITITSHEQPMLNNTRQQNLDILLMPPAKSQTKS